MLCENLLIYLSQKLHPLKLKKKKENYSSRVYEFYVCIYEIIMSLNNILLVN